MADKDKSDDKDKAKAAADKAAALARMADHAAKIAELWSAACAAERDTLEKQIATGAEYEAAFKDHKAAGLDWKDWCKNHTHLSERQVRNLRAVARNAAKLRKAAAKAKKAGYTMGSAFGLIAKKGDPLNKNAPTTKMKITADIFKRSLKEAKINDTEVVLKIAKLFELLGIKVEGDTATKATPAAPAETKPKSKATPATPTAKA